MNIFTKIKNHVEYAYYRKLYDVSTERMLKYGREQNEMERRKWEKNAVKAFTKCMIIPLH
jgi:hypothetical protein